MSHDESDCVNCGEGVGAVASSGGDRTSEATVPLPDGLYLTNGGQRCDMLVGPCACGATHGREERLAQLVEVCAQEDLKGARVALEGIVREHRRYEAGETDSLGALDEAVDDAVALLNNTPKRVSAEAPPVIDDPGFDLADVASPEVQAERVAAARRKLAKVRGAEDPLAPGAWVRISAGAFRGWAAQIVNPQLGDLDDAPHLRKVAIDGGHSYYRTEHLEPLIPRRERATPTTLPEAEATVVECMRNGKLSQSEYRVDDETTLLVSLLTKREPPHGYVRQDQFLMTEEWLHKAEHERDQWQARATRWAVEARLDDDRANETEAKARKAMGNAIAKLLPFSDISHGDECPARFCEDNDCDCPDGEEETAHRTDDLCECTVGVIVRAIDDLRFAFAPDAEVMPSSSDPTAHEAKEKP